MYSCMVAHFRTRARVPDKFAARNTPDALVAVRRRPRGGEPTPSWRMIDARTGAMVPSRIKTVWKNIALHLGIRKFETTVEIVEKWKLMWKTLETTVEKWKLT